MSPAPAAPTVPPHETDYLAKLGERVRGWRGANSTTRKSLASASGVSERYLAKLESGEGNISVLLLRKLALAMGVPVASLLRDEHESASRRIALLGLRGAGKSSLGKKLAASLAIPFIELDLEVEHEAGARLGEIFALYGQEAYRRFERRALERVLGTQAEAVIAVGGSLVTDPGSYQLLLDHCRCCWLKATPAEHMNRVIAQGDMRPFEGSPKGKSTAIDEIRRLLADREHLYARASFSIDTSGKPLKAALEELKGKLRP